MSRCAEFCAGRLHGIVANLKLTGEITTEDFAISVRAMRRGLNWVPRGSYEMTCEHGQKFVVREERRAGR